MDMKPAYSLILLLTSMLKISFVEGEFTNGDVLSSVVYELSHLKHRVNVCEKKFTELDERVLTCEDQLQSTEFLGSQKRYTAVVNTLKTTEKRLAEAETRLSVAERKLETSENLYSQQLHEMQERLRAAEAKLESSEKLLAESHEMESKIRGAEIKQKVTEAFHKNQSVKGTEEFKDNQKDSDDDVQVSYSVGKTDLEHSTTDINNSKSNITGPVKTETKPFDLKATVNKSENRVPGAPISKRLLGPVVNHRIAFTAYLSQDVSELGMEHTIPFDQVLLNEGQAFDTVLHVFFCPVNGIYIFQAALMCAHNQYLLTEIVKDGSPLVRMYAAGATTGNGYDQGSNFAIIQCNKGERVWVRIDHHWGTAVYSSQYSSFSGFLLWET